MFERPHNRRKARPDWNHGHRLQDDPDFDRWTTPSDYQTAEVERHELPSLKGSTMTELPSLNAVAEGW